MAPVYTHTHKRAHVHIYVYTCYIIVVIIIVNILLYYYYERWKNFDCGSGSDRFYPAVIYAVINGRGPNNAR